MECFLFVDIKGCFLHIPHEGESSEDSFVVKPKEKKLYMQWATVSANYKAVNVASAFSNDVPLAISGENNFMIHFFIPFG